MSSLSHILHLGIKMANGENGNGNGNSLDSKLGRYLGWASLIAAIALQAGIVVSRVNQVGSDLHDAVVIIRQVQVDLATRTAQLAEVERRVGRLENALWTKSK